MTKKIIIAIDGHSSCGKSTMAKDLAKEINYTYIDTGAMYRAITLYCLQNKLIQDKEVNEDALKKQLSEIKIEFKTIDNQTFTFLNDINVEKEIRTLQVANKVSLVASIGFVRTELVKKQQEMGEKKGIVMDGRDIGTVVFPSAELKLFITASPEIRAQRRFKEMLAKGENANFEDVLKNVKERDLIDSTRKESPLRQAEDAIVLDNSEMTIQDQKKWILDQYSNVIKKIENDSSRN